MHQMKVCTALVGVCTAAVLGLPWLMGATSVFAKPVPRISVNPPVNGGPGGRSPGGSRIPDCLGTQSITRLNSAATTEAVTAQYPTFSFRVPPTPAKTAEFVLIAGSKQVYKSTLNLNKTAEVVNVSLPTKSGLEVGKNYNWVFKVVCNAERPDGNPFVKGKVTRIQ